MWCYRIQLTRALFIKIENLATNDAAHRSLSEYAVLAIAPDLGPNNLAEGEGDEDTVTLVISGSRVLVSSEKFNERSERESSWKTWKKFFCL